MEGRNSLGEGHGGEETSEETVRLSRERSYWVGTGFGGMERVERGGSEFMNG